MNPDTQKSEGLSETAVRDTGPETEATEGARFIDDYLAYLLARASHLVSRRFHETLGSKGIGVPDWRVLASLSDGDKVSLGALARITLFKQPTLTKIIDRMERDGTVRRRPSTDDRRKVLIEITDAGRDLVGQLLVQAKRQEDDVLREYHHDQQGVLKTTLRDLIHRLDPPA